MGRRTNGSSRVRYAGLDGPCFGRTLKVNLARALRIGRLSVNRTVWSSVFSTLSMNSYRTFKGVMVFGCIITL